MSSLFASLVRFLKRLFRLEPRHLQPVEGQANQGRSTSDQSTLNLQNGRSPVLETATGSNGQSAQFGVSAMPTPSAISPVSPELRRLIYRATRSMPKPRMHAGQFGSLLRKQDD
ncbi:MAG: hypothetical protein WA949_15940, partial [Phormidesmis sp.]